MAKVMPHGDPEVSDMEGEGVLSLKNMNPDFNNDGVVDAMEKAIYTKMMDADLDKDGFLTRTEVFGLISKSIHEIKSASSKGGIPLGDLNPDTDGDGQIEDWEKEVYARIVAADTDNTGTISVRNLFDFIRNMSNEVKEAAAGGIPIKTLNPDTDGDGKVEAWETEVFERIKAADEDASGSISVKELFGVIKGAAESDRQKRLFRKLFMVSVVVIMFLILANFALAYVAVNLAATLKASGGSGAMISKETNVAAKTGDMIIPAETQDVRQRRLRVIGGRKLVSVAAVSGDVVSTFMNEFSDTGTCALTFAYISADQRRRSLNEVVPEPFPLNGRRMMPSPVATPDLYYVDSALDAIDNAGSSSYDAQDIGDVSMEADGASISEVNTGNFRRRRTRARKLEEETPKRDPTAWMRRENSFMQLGKLGKTYNHASHRKLAAKKLFAAHTPPLTAPKPSKRELFAEPSPSPEFIFPSADSIPIVMDEPDHTPSLYDYTDLTKEEVLMEYVEGCVYVRTITEQDNTEIVLVDCGEGEVPLVVVMDGQHRQLSLEESHVYRRRRMAQVGMHHSEDSSRFHFDECVLYHCFESDYDCHEPSPPEACLRWNADDTCADALCHYYHHEGDQGLYALDEESVRKHEEALRQTELAATQRPATGGRAYQEFDSRSEIEKAADILGSDMIS